MIHTPGFRSPESAYLSQFVADEDILVVFVQTLADASILPDNVLLVELVEEVNGES